MTGLRSIPTLLALLALMAGCAPAISPLYRDYVDESDAVADRESERQLVRVRAALAAAGWEVLDGTAGATLRTESRRFRNWGLYTIEVELEAAPVAGDHVRVFVHPYRKFVTGRRSKIPYLRPRLADDIMGEVTRELETAGLQYAGTAQQRDRRRY